MVPGRRGKDDPRTTPPPAEYRRHEARGLCELCYDQERPRPRKGREAGRLDQYPRLTRPPMVAPRRPPLRPFDLCTLDEGESP